MQKKNLPRLTYGAPDIMNLANQFLLTGKRAIELKDQQAFMAPACANFAFAAELYMKAIVQCETGKPWTKSTGGGSGHNLEKLFQRLSSASQTAIFIATKRSRADFDMRLELNQEAFELLRYLFEQGGNVDPPFMEDFALGCKQVAESLTHPRPPQPRFLTASEQDIQ